MARKKHSPSRDRTPAPPRALLGGLDQVDDLLADRAWSQARAQLGLLAQRYPDHPEVLIRQLEVARHLDDSAAYLRAARRLNQAQPDQPSTAIALLGGYLRLAYPALALRTARDFLARWPAHEAVASMAETRASLEEEISAILRGVGLSDPADLPLAELHDEVRWLVSEGQLAQARRVADEALRRWPTFLAMFNLVATCDLLDEKPAAASATARQALALDPDNIFAWAALVRALCLSGQLDEAARAGERLKAIAPAGPSQALKQAETLSLLGDDRGVLAAFEAANQLGIDTLRLGLPLFYHLAAVASLRLGDEEQARQHWQTALRHDLRFELARTNLDDLRQPVGERQAPWPFTLLDWIGPRAARALQGALLPALPRRNQELFDRGLRRYLRQHPSLIALAPLLLDHGDPPGRTLALKTAVMLRTPPLLAALRAFAASQRGSTDMRQQAAAVVAEMEAGVAMPPAPAITDEPAQEEA